MQKTRISPRKSKLYTIVHKAKDIERNLVFSALKNVVDDTFNNVYNGKNFIEILLLKKPYSSTEIKEVFNFKIDREFAKIKKRNPELSYVEITKIKKEIEEIKNNLQTLDKIKHTKYITKEILYLAKISQNIKKFNLEYEKLLKHIKTIKKLTDKGIASKKTNQAILYELRKALKTSIYQFYKEQEDHPAIKFLHTLCLASYTEPKLLDSFKPIGEAIKATISGECEISEANFANTIGKSLKSAYMHGLIRSNKNLEYLRKAPYLMWGNILSSYLGHNLSNLGVKFYDPRGDLENNAGALYQETFIVGEKKCTARNIYTPSPTIGNRISEEAKGLLQAMENRNFMDQETLNKDPYPFRSWVYTNLQDITSRNESPRSTAIMQLNDEFPFSFHGITLSLDSEFYFDGAYGDENKVQKAINNVTTVKPEAYKEKMQSLLYRNSNFTLEKRKKDIVGYYFPTRTSEEKAEWKNALSNITELAFNTVQKQKKINEEDDWDWHKRAAFRVLVHIGIIKYYQAKIAKQLGCNDLFDKHHMLTTNACKENVDRGGKTNASLLWALCDQAEKSHLDRVFSAIHSRALLSRMRLIFPDRIEPMKALVNSVTQKDVQSFLEDNTKLGGALQSGYAKPLHSTT